ncbi:MAG TPA: ATP-dependent helicase [Aridibacter sp.]|nr:ATP-dependent helicase [Aridibacter sp.]
MKKYVIKRDRSGLPEKLTRYRSELNDEQFRVVTSKPGPTLVIAGAGSGKTRTITYRVAYLLEHGVSPDKILLATFTNRAAREMLGRVEALTGTQNVHRVWGGTFHRVANLLLRRHAVSIGYDSNYTILDSEDARSYIDLAIEDSAIDTSKKRFPKSKVIQDIVSYATNTDRPIEDVVVRKYPYFEMLTQQIKRVDLNYGERKRQRNAMDYDDLLLNCKRLLIEKPEIGDLYATQFEHVLVDEYQDTNKLQAEIIDLLAVKHKNVMVVGDDAQSIFAWRGAEFSNIYEFAERYPGTQEYRLETNYRSTPEILALANVSIANNKRQFRKNLSAVRKPSEFNPALVPCSDIDQQSAFVASRILELRDEGTSLEDIAVLYRSHYHALELQLELTKRNIPYRVQSGVRFFEQAHLKDVISFLKIVVNPRDELAWKRILMMMPGIGKVTAHRIFEAVAVREEPHALIRSEALALKDPSAPDQGAFPASVRPRNKRVWSDLISLLEDLTDDSNRNRPGKQIEMILGRVYEEHLKGTYENAEVRLEDIRQLAIYASRYQSTDEFLSELALISTERFGSPTGLAAEDVVSGGEEDELLTLSSIHQAKGLEWKAVFLIWAAEGKFPSPRSLNEPDSEEEERRLWYVALTRAKDELYITYPLMIFDYNRQTVVQKPSRFVLEVPPAMYEIWDLEEDTSHFDDPVETEEKQYLN